MHGYELKRRVQRPTFARLGNSALYPALRRFEDAGAVTKVVEQHDGKPARKVYTITDSGRTLFRELLSSLPPDLAVNEEEFLVRVSFFSELTRVERLAILSTRATVVNAKVAQVAALMAERQPRTEGFDWPHRAIDQFLLRLRLEREWITGLMKEQEQEEDGNDDH